MIWNYGVRFCLSTWGVIEIKEVLQNSYLNLFGDIDKKETKKWPLTFLIKSFLKFSRGYKNRTLG